MRRTNFYRIKRIFFYYYDKYKEFFYTNYLFIIPFSHPAKYLLLPHNLTRNSSNFHIHLSSFKIINNKLFSVMKIFFLLDDIPEQANCCWPWGHFPPLLTPSQPPLSIFSGDFSLSRHNYHFLLRWIPLSFSFSTTQALYVTLRNPLSAQSLHMIPKVLTFK